jgi:glycerol-3-phosphate acyltransferase PlsX
MTMDSDPRPVRIALDAMGGDYAPGVVVDGAVQAARAFPGVHIVLVGLEQAIKTELAKFSGVERLPISVVHASEVVGMEEHTLAVKEKKDSSMVVGVRLVKEKEADAFVTAGNSGAGMAAALFGLGRIRGIERPAFCTVYPAAPNTCILLDMGANTDPKPEHLLQNGLMGSLYAERVLGIPRPRVGLVSNGEEADKGSMVVRDAYKLLAASGLNFIGNVEGKDITRGVADVVVTDGFTGNVIIKLSEGIFSFLIKTLKRQFTSGALNKVGLVLLIPGALLMIPGLALLAPAARALARKVDWREYGAAPVLGVNGVVLIGHGRSDAKAIRNAVRAAIQAARHDVVGDIRSGLAASAPSGS